ncbi:MAG: hypothetical protein HKN31_14145 [Pricia sp.]|nr:hypothetical protein [Pricia sp.]
MVVAILLGFLFFVLLYLLFVPIELYFNTDTNQYYAQLRGLAKVSIEGDREEVIRIRLRTLFRNFYFYPLRKSGTESTKKIEKTKKKRRKTRIGFKKIIGVMKSFKTKQLFLDMDTGDCLMNAKLYPVFTFINYYKGNLNINYLGRNQLVLHLENRPIRIIRSFINI